MKQISDEYALFGIIRESLNTPLNSDIQLSSRDFDDCALLRINDETSLAITSDFIRGSGFYLFELGYLNYFDVGYYLIGANLSDLASMGADPVGITTVIRYSKNMDDEDFRSVFQGMNDICVKYSVPIIGGDIGGHSCDVFAATAFGKVITKKALKRSNIKNDHIVCVTGPVGDAIAALTYFKDIKSKCILLDETEERLLLNKWKKVTPRIQEGLLLSRNFNYIGCQDISDGLKATVLQMSALSKKGFTLYEEKIPVSQPTKRIADFLKIDKLQLAFSASVDFELLVTISEADLGRAQKLFADSGMSLIPIGFINQHGRNELIRSDNTSQDIPGVEWKQQSSDILQDIIR